MAPMRARHLAVLQVRHPAGKVASKAGLRAKAAVVADDGADAADPVVDLVADLVAVRVEAREADHGPRVQAQPSCDCRS